jgi:hypothetical protein
LDGRRSWGKIQARTGPRLQKGTHCTFEMIKAMTRCDDSIMCIKNRGAQGVQGGQKLAKQLARDTGQCCGCDRTSANGRARCIQSLLLVQCNVAGQGSRVLASGNGQVGPHRWGRARREGATRAYATATDSAQEAKPPRGSTAHLVAGLQGLLTRTHQHKSSPSAGCTDPGRRQKLLPPSTRAATAYRHSTEAPAERCVSWRACAPPGTSCCTGAAWRQKVQEAVRAAAAACRACEVVHCG